MSIAIRAEGLSKEYRLGIINHGVLFRDIQSWIAKKRGLPDPHSKLGSEHFSERPDRFWALQDLSFEIEQGDRVGIIGRNGAGKSTLLKILSRITEPTEGRVKIRGRVASLLEVGTGFHPELTGRDNIYLSGAIRGMKKREIDRKIDEIIDFSEIEKFIDTPVKRYSSGMYVRLGFAVAAHLESEILLADEVLAVGDQAFQNKCLRKMEEVSKSEGRAVVFVSHNIGSVSALCQKGLVIRNGRLVYNGTVRDAIAFYSLGDKTKFYQSEKNTKETGIRSVWFEDNRGEKTESIVNGNSYSVCIEFYSDGSSDLEFRIVTQDDMLRPLWAFTNAMYGKPPIRTEGVAVFRLKVLNQSITSSETSFDITLRNFASTTEKERIENLTLPVLFTEADASIRRYPTWPILGKLECDLTLV